LKFITKFLSKRINVLGECIVDERFSSSGYLNSIQSEFLRFIKKENIVEVVISGYFGNIEKLIDLGNQSLSSDYYFNTANLNLLLTKEQLWENLHAKHRNVIRKAEKEHVKFIESDNVDLFNILLKETYVNQGLKDYNTNFSSHLFKEFHKKGLVKIYFAKHNEIYLSGAMVVILGSKAYYAFGGNIQNSLGAGNFLQWNLFLDLKEKGIDTYCLGQVAVEKDGENEKFSVGISQFKKRFGTYELLSYKKSYVYFPIRNKLFKFLTKTFIS
jgi:lipid II:glycine glycyltransferase (peptidoglycan interpeptide bridge formation enzyme)